MCFKNGKLACEIAGSQFNICSHNAHSHIAGTSNVVSTHSIVIILVCLSALAQDNDI